MSNHADGRLLKLPIVELESMALRGPDPTLPRPTLSAREIEVMLAWFRSDSKAGAAHELFISIGTINTHIARIRGKYSAVGRTAPTKAALFVRALQDGHTTLDEW